MFTKCESLRLKSKGNQKHMRVAWWTSLLLLLFGESKFNACVRAMLWFHKSANRMIFIQKMSHSIWTSANFRKRKNLSNFFVICLESVWKRGRACVRQISRFVCYLGVFCRKCLIILLENVKLNANGCCYFLLQHSIWIKIGRFSLLAHFHSLSVIEQINSGCCRWCSPFSSTVFYFIHFVFFYLAIGI